MRTLVLVAGILLVAALAVFLTIGKWRNPLNLKELPKKLGFDIQSDASGFTLEHAYGEHSRYKIHASKAVQYKQGNAILHDVKIELYGEDGSRVDRIAGSEFLYDTNKHTVVAQGPVEITLMRPGVAPAIANEASGGKTAALKSADGKSKNTPLASAAETAARGEIHVKTSGLTFDEQSGVATTTQHVDFSMEQGTGNSMGATYDSKQGHLVLDRAVELTTERGGDQVVVHAQHAEFERADMICRLHAAVADYRGGEATAGNAKILFREDGSAVRLDAMDGFTMATSTGGHVTAPQGELDFNQHNQPQHGHLEGGVTMDETREPVNGSPARQVHGTAPSAELNFTDQGELRHTHLERGVEMHSDEQSVSAAGPLRVSRTWKSPVADVEFRDNGHGQAEPASIHGTDGVVITGDSQRGKAPVVPSRLAADEVTGSFGPNSTLTGMIGTGHAEMEQTTAAGTRQTSSGDRLNVQFAPQAAATGSGGAKAGENAKAAENKSGAAQIQSAILDGHVVLVQQPVPKPGDQPAAPMRATAGHAVYEGSGEWLHLTVNPRVDDGGLQVTAEKIDVSHETGDAFAHGDVKATWLGNGAGSNTGNGGQPGAGANHGVAANQSAAASQGGVNIGGSGPTHVIATEAQLHQATGEATFRGHARLWQQVNSVAGPVIVLDRQRQTLVATTSDASEPVKAVLVSVQGPTAAGGKTPAKNAPAKESSPSVIRVRGGDLKYSDAERKAVMHAGVLGSVTAETGTAVSVSNEVDLLLLPPGNHAGPDGGQAQVDRLTARGHVVLTSEGRRSTGEQMVYTGETGDYVLTGTAAAPPRMNDPARGNVTGEALIFHSRDDSVSIEGGGSRTTTETRAPK